MAALTAVTAGDISDSCNLIMNSGDLKLSPDSGLSQEEPVVERTKTETILEPGGDYLLGIATHDVTAPLHFMNQMREGCKTC